MQAQPPFEFVSSKSSSEDILMCYRLYISHFLDDKDSEGIYSNKINSKSESGKSWSPLDLPKIWIKVTKQPSFDKWDRILSTLK